MTNWIDFRIYLPTLLSLLVAVLWFYRSKIFISVKKTNTITPILDQYSRDLTKLAHEGRLDPVIGREEEIVRVIQVLSRRTQNNPILVGKSGVGKTAITEGLAQQIAAKKVPRNLIGKRVLALNLSDLISGTKYRGEFEQRMKHITSEIIKAKRSIVLFVDEVHMLAGAGEAVGGITAKDILKPALARGDLQMVGATTPKEFSRYIEKDQTLIRRLEPIFIDEPSAVDTVLMLKGIKKEYEDYHGVIIPDEVLDDIVELSNKCFPDRYFPDKAIDLLDETAARIKLTKKDKQVKPIMSIKDIKEVVKDKKQDQKHF